MAIERTGFNSTALQGATYDSEAEVLTVVFRNGESYIYEGVPVDLWRGLKDSDSAGSFFYNYIKGVY